MFPKIAFGRLSLPKSGTVVCFCDEKGTLGTRASDMDKNSDKAISRAKKSENFSAKARESLNIIAPAGGMDRIILISTGKQDEMDERDWQRLGGVIIGQMGKSNQKIHILAETVKDEKIKPEYIAAIAQGIKLGAYKFDKYITKTSDGKKAQKTATFTLASASPTAAKRAWEVVEGVADGIIVARNLVNEPANILGPVEFAREAKKLEKLGVKIQILGETELAKLKMGALLGVAQGSRRPARMVVMQWKGGKGKQMPVAFVGKGVVFDTGGISLKPAAGMEDMKGDMGGAAAVVGVMHALAARKAKANVVGIIGLVENMPDGNAQRPGDIVTSMSGQTIEVINTDAEGRLVLADALWYCEDKFKPQVMINLATLTGACVVALGKEYAGLFANDDSLAEQLSASGEASGDKVWRMPLSKEYDEMINTKVADMKNVGGRWAGAITAAQFLQRFVRNAQWAHLDIAGTALGSPQNEINRSWSSGFGVALLNRLVADYYE